jgi:IS5 family transposase
MTDASAEKEGGAPRMDTAKGKHPLLIIKRIFGFTHVRYRGLAKNGTRFEVLCTLANLYMKRRVLMRYCHV